MNRLNALLIPTVTKVAVAIAIAVWAAKMSGEKAFDKLTETDRSNW